MNTSQLKRHSKFLSLVLRHKPEVLSLQLDTQGWISVDTLLQAMQQNGRALQHNELETIVAENDKQRFMFSEDGKMIRARQGHSIQVDLGYESATPPPTLFHGTATRFVGSIWKQGLIKGNRHHVHLSADLVTATKVGSRHGKPYIFTIRSEEMAEDGFEFFVTGNGVWLVDHVPTKYLTGES
ncbi:MAG: RNA 2'-phosphotransferase [Bacteroidota bacterium]